MSRPDLSDDESLAAALSATLDHLDPVPPAATRAAAAAAEMRHADGELAVLVAESSLEDTLVLREEGGATTMTFAASHVTVEIEIDRQRHVVGMLTPPLETVVEAEMSSRQHPSRSSVTRSDELGRFQVDLSAGLCRLRIGDGSDSVVTSWFIC